MQHWHLYVQVKKLSIKNSVANENTQLLAPPPREICVNENFSVNENSGTTCPDVHNLLAKTWSVPQSGAHPLSDAGYVLSRGWGGSPKGMCACPPSRRLSPHICALHQPKSWARISACRSSYARWRQWPSGWPSGQQGLQLAPPQSSAESPPTQIIVAHHSLAHWSTKLLKPLCQFNVAMSAMEVIPGISRWVLGVIKRRYTLQFRHRPPHFNGVVQSLSLPWNALVLRQEVYNLLKKGVIEKVPPSELESGFYSRYFVVPKRDGGLRPILGLRPINGVLKRFNAETDPGPISPWGLVCVRGFKGCVHSSGGPLSALTCCVNVRLLSAIKKISPLIYSQSWVGSWVYTTQAMMTFTLIF